MCGNRCCSRSLRYTHLTCIHTMFPTLLPSLVLTAYTPLPPHGYSHSYLFMLSFTPLPMHSTTKTFLTMLPSDCTSLHTRHNRQRNRRYRQLFFNMSCMIRYITTCSRRQNSTTSCTHPHEHYTTKLLSELQLRKH